MHNKLCIKLLMALIMAIPTLSVAADVPPAGETRVAAPAQATESTPRVIAPEIKPVATTAVRQTTKIGYVDIVRIGTESDKGKALRTLLESKRNKLQGRIEEKKKQIEKLKISIESKISTMTPPQREAKSKEFQKKLEEFQKYAQASEKEFFELQEKETGALYEEIEKSAAAHGAANGFAVIVVKKELLYIGSSVDAQDVTEALVKSLNEAGQKK